MKALNVIDCTTADEFWAKLAPETPLRPRPSGFVYRGHGDAEWALIPSALPRTPGARAIAEIVFGGRPVNGDDQIWPEHRVLHLFVEACDRAGPSERLFAISEGVVWRGRLLGSSYERYRVVASAGSV